MDCVNSPRAIYYYVQAQPALDRSSLFCPCAFFDARVHFSISAFDRSKNAYAVNLAGFIRRAFGTVFRQCKSASICIMCKMVRYFVISRLNIKRFRIIILCE